MDTGKKGSDGFLELLKRGVVFRVEHFVLGELPEPLDEVQIGGIRRQEEQLDSEGLCG